MQQDGSLGWSFWRASRSRRRSYETRHGKGIECQSSRLRALHKAALGSKFEVARFSAGASGMCACRRTWRRAAALACLRYWSWRGGNWWSQSGGWLPLVMEHSSKPEPRTHSGPLPGTFSDRPRFFWPPSLSQQLQLHLLWVEVRIHSRDVHRARAAHS